MTARPLPLTVFVSVDDVIEALGRSRSFAYEQLRRAPKRKPGERGLLRVSITLWECYIREEFPCASSDAVTHTIDPKALAAWGVIDTTGMDHGQYGRAFGTVVFFYASQIAQYPQRPLEFHKERRCTERQSQACAREGDRARDWRPHPRACGGRG